MRPLTPTLLLALVFAGLMAALPASAQPVPGRSLVRPAQLSTRALPALDVAAIHAVPTPPAGKGALAGTLGNRADELVLDDGNDLADDFLGFNDGTPFYWANRFQLGSRGFSLEGFTFYMRTEAAASNRVYLAVRNAQGERLAGGVVDYDVAPGGGWYAATLDPVLTFARGEAFFIEVGHAAGVIGFPAGIDGDVLTSSAAPVAYIAGAEQAPLEAVGGDFQRDAFLIRASGTLTTNANAAPSIVHEPSAAPGRAGEPLTVTATITDDGGVARATLLYQEGGSSAPRTAAMTPGAGGFVGTIPAAAITARGLRYAIEAEDAAGLTTRTPWRSQPVRVEGDGLQRSLGWSGDAYRLVSVPLVLDADGAGSVFEDDLGGYDVNRWRLYGLEASQSYAEHPRAGRLQAGRAFWLALRDAGQGFDTGPGTSAPLDRPYEISLHAGWNLVGTPFNFDVPLDRVRLASGGALDIRAFNGSWNTHAGPLRPFEGYAVFVPAADRLEVWPMESSGGPSRLQGPEAERLAWSVRVIAETDRARDAFTVAAVGAAARQGWDAADRAEPPTIGAYVSAYFPAPPDAPVRARLGRDVRPPADAHVWNLHVETGRPETVRLRLADLDALPAGADVWITDVRTGHRQNLRTGPAYAFASAGDGEVRIFRLEITPSDAPHVPPAFTLHAPYPNPFNPQTTIRYELPAAGDVRLAAYDLLGREAVVLVEGRQRAGPHAVTWDAAGLPSGVYLVRLQAAGLVRTQRVLLLK